MGCCTGTKFAVGVVVVLAIACVVLAAALIWRERSRPMEIDTKLSVDIVRQRYPSMFRTEEEQRVYEELYLSGFYNSTVVNETVDPINYQGQQCEFNCQTINPKRRKWAIQPIYHGCCTSSVSFIVPTVYPSVSGELRTFVQFPIVKQFFAVHSCQMITPCSGCQCSQQDTTYSAVVVKIGVIDPEDIEDIEVAIFFVPGCCKCINN